MEGGEQKNKRGAKTAAVIASVLAIAGASYGIAFFGLGHGVAGNVRNGLSVSSQVSLRMYQATLVVLAILAIRHWILHRTRPNKYISAAFTVFAASLLIAQVLLSSGYQGEAYIWFRKLGLSLASLYPYFLFEFVFSFGDIKKRLRGFFLAATGATITAGLLLPAIPRIGEPRPWLYSAYLVLYTATWVVTSLFVAGMLWRASRQQVRLVRNRLRLLSAATVILAGRVLLINIINDNSLIFINIISLAGVLCLALGYTPPLQLRHRWRREEEKQLNDAIASLMQVQTRREVAEHLLPSLSALMGAKTIKLTNHDGESIAFYGQDIPAGNSGSIISIDQPFGKLELFADPYAPHLSNEDIEQLSSLGTLVNLAFERIEIQEAERKASNNYRKIFENSVEGIFQTTPDGNLVSANPALAKICGYDTPEEAMRSINFIGQQSVYVNPNRHNDFVDEITKHGHINGFESEIYRKDGTKVWIRENARAVTSKNGEIIFFEGTVEDITVRKRVEKELVESERRFKQSFDSAPIGIALVDSDLRFIRFNRSYAELLGYEEDELLHKTIMEITHPDDLVRDQARAELLMRGEISGYRSEKRYIKKDGSTVWVELSTTLIRDESGEVLYAMGMIQDITERKTSAEELQKANRYLAALHDTTLALINRLEVKELLNGILQRAGAMLDSPHGMIYIVDSSQSRLRLEYGIGLFEDRVGGELEKGQGLAGKVWESGVAMTVADYDTWEGRSKSVPPGKYKSIAGVPIVSEGTIIGVLSIAYREADQVLDSQKIEILTRLAELVSVGLDNARLYSLANRAAQIIELSTDAIYTIDADGIITSWNQGAERLYGYFAEEAIGQSINIIVPTDHSSEIDKELQLIRRGERLLQLETVRKRKDGSLVDVSINVSPTRTHNKYSGGAVIARDITHSKETQRALLDGQEELKEAQQIALIGSWSWDIKDNKLAWSDQLYRIYGLNPGDDIDEEYVASFNHPKDAQMILDASRAAFERGEPFDYDYRIIRKDGTYGILHAIGRVESDENGKPVKLSGTLQDVTEQRLSDEIIKQSEERFRSLAQNARDAIITASSSGTITYFNKAAESLFGYSEGEVFGKSLQIIMPERFRLQHQAGLDHYSHTGEGKIMGQQVEVLGLRKDGTEVPIELSLSSWAVNEQTSYIAIIRDITERRKLEEMKSDFVAMVSHQLKTPLAIIRGYTDNLLLGITGPLTDRQIKYLEEMRDISDKYYGLIAKLLDVTRVERGGVSVDLKPMELKTIVENVVVNHKNRLAKKGLKLEVGGLEEPILVKADFEKASEAINNILDNAIKYTSEGGISILAGSDGVNGWLEVTDTGPGFSKENLEKAFKRDQVFAGAPKAEGGAGLGLFIAKEFMNLQGGDITIESELGHGTKFTFTLPLAKVEIESEAAHG